MTAANTALVSATCFRWSNNGAVFVSLPCIEFSCEGCGSHVRLLGVIERPTHGFCVICAFLSEYVSDDPAELVELRARIARDLATD